jgi:membrane-associated phospholipid phosphatase
LAALLNFLTDFADQAVALPLVLAVLLGLLGLRWWRGAGAWALAACFTFGTILLLKIVFAACATQLAATGIHSPSGHTASACLVYGGLFVLLARRPSHMLTALFIAAAFAIVFGYSRLALEVHTPGDVAAGGLIGLLGVAVLVVAAGRRPEPLLRWPIGVSVVGVLVVFHGFRLPAEGAIRHFALADWIPFLSACHA